MVDNQHKKISGYRDLTLDEIALINEIKAVGEELSDLLIKVRVANVPIGDATIGQLETINESSRWLGIAETHLQQGLMAAVRAVAKPEFF